MFKSNQSQPTNTQATGRPTLRDVYPVWGVLSDKLLELCRREESILQRIGVIDRERWRRNAIVFDAHADGGPLGYNGPPVSITLPAKSVPPISARVRALLGEVAPQPPSPPLVPTEPVVEYVNPGDQESADLSKEYTDIQAAKAILHPLLKAAQEEGSKRLCAELAGEYRPVAGNICAAIVALGDALVAHDDFTQLMVEGGASWHWLRPVDVNTLKGVVGDPRDLQYSRLRRLLASAAEGGWFDMASIPNGWTPVPVVAASPEPRERLVPATRRGAIRGADTIEASIVPNQ